MIEADTPDAGIILDANSKIISQLCNAIAGLLVSGDSWIECINGRTRTTITVSVQASHSEAISKIKYESYKINLK